MARNDQLETVRAAALAQPGAFSPATLRVCTPQTVIKHVRTLIDLGEIEELPPRQVGANMVRQFMCVGRTNSDTLGSVDPYKDIYPEFFTPPKFRVLGTRKVRHF